MATPFPATKLRASLLTFFGDSLVAWAQKRVWENLETNLNIPNLAFSGRRLASPAGPLFSPPEGYCCGRIFFSPTLFLKHMGFEAYGLALVKNALRIFPVSFV